MHTSPTKGTPTHDGKSAPSIMYVFVCCVAALFFSVPVSLIHLLYGTVFSEICIVDRPPTFTMIVGYRSWPPTINHPF